MPIIWSAKMVVDCGQEWVVNVCNCFLMMQAFHLAKIYEYLYKPKGRPHVEFWWGLLQAILPQSQTLKLWWDGRGWSGQDLQLLWLISWPVTSLALLEYSQGLCYYQPPELFQPHQVSHTYIIGIICSAIGCSKIWAFHYLINKERKKLSSPTYWCRDLQVVQTSHLPSKKARTCH